MGALAFDDQHEVAATDEVAGVAALAPPGFGGTALPDLDEPVVLRHALFERLDEAARVSLVSAPAGSGKTWLLRSWLRGLACRSAWVTVDPDDDDGRGFWASVINELAWATGPDGPVRPVSPSPDPGDDALVTQLLSQARSLREPVVLVIDDLHELSSPEALHLLEWFLRRVPQALRVVLATRAEPRAGLHRLRLAGQLIELRSDDLRFTAEAARELLEGSGVQLSDESLSLLCERTEGWVAGLRLAAITLAGHDDPDGFVCEFSGCERTVAAYLVAEVLDQQPPEVRDLLLRTSILRRVSGPLADALTGGAGSERVLQGLADAGAFATAVDTGRSWFRYHRLFADLLRVELHRGAPRIVSALHRTAWQWHEAHGDVVEAIRHAQAALDWPDAARLLALHFRRLVVEGGVSTITSMLEGFPRAALDANAELAVVVGGVCVEEGHLEEGARYLEAGRRLAATLADDRRPAFDLLLADVELWLAGRRGDVDGVIDAAQNSDEAFSAQSTSALMGGGEQQFGALHNLGVARLWESRPDMARRHLEDALALARRIRQPYLEISSLGILSIAATLDDAPLSVARGFADDAVAIAEANGWAECPVTGPAFAVAGAAHVWLGHFEEAERDLERADRAQPAGGDPGTGVILQHAWGLLRLAQGRLEDAVDTFRAADAMQERLVAEHPFTIDLHSRVLRAQVELGDLDEVRAALDGMEDRTRRWAAMRIAEAAVDLAEDRPEAALEALAPVLEGTAPALRPRWATVEALLLAACARVKLGDRPAAEASLEHALDLAESEGIVLPFLITPAAHGLLERHPGHRTAHATLLTEIRHVLAGSAPVRPGAVAPLRDALSDAELRVVRYLPTNLTAPEIASQLYVSPNTVRTHLRHVYAKLDAHSRAEAVARARDLGLLAPSLRVRSDARAAA